MTLIYLMCLQDGSHIKGLLINFIHHNWPTLLHRDFMEEFITPIVKASKGGQEIPFYSLPEFEEWKKSRDNWHTYKIKYYKGADFWAFSSLLHRGFCLGIKVMVSNICFVGCHSKLLCFTTQSFLSSRFGYFDLKGGEGILCGHDSSPNCFQLQWCTR